MSKKALKILLLCGFSCLLFSFTAFADVAFPTTTTIYFQQDSQSWDHPVDYTVNCYGYYFMEPWDPTAPEDYDPENPDLVYDYDVYCDGYGCLMYENYYANYLSIDYCNLEGETLGQQFILEEFATHPQPENCEFEEIEQYCEVYYDLPLDLDPAPVVEPPFPDVPEDHPNLDAISYVKDEGIVQGYPDGNYGPDLPINRAEFTKIIIKSVYTEEDINNCTSELNFPDVQITDWFHDFICVAGNEQIINGYPDGTFKPADNINFVEAAKIIVNAFGYSYGASNYWYIPYVEVLIEKNAIPMSIDNLDKKITRGEMAEIIYRLKMEITGKASNNDILN
ncbi:S-layer homology domain-containing protein [Patescibacteria group bacterium]